MNSLSIPHVESTPSWKQIAQHYNFTYPWRNETPPKTIFQAYHDKDHVHFKYTAIGKNPLVYVKTNHKLEVIHSERVEIFFRKNTELNPYYCFEIDPHGRVLDYEAKHYREFNRAWHWPGDLNIKTKIIEDRYTVEGHFEKSLLIQLGLLLDGKLQVGLYRGHCTELKGDQAEIKWISWINSGTKEPDFHVASSFGEMILE